MQGYRLGDKVSNQTTDTLFGKSEDVWILDENPNANNVAWMTMESTPSLRVQANLCHFKRVLS